MGGFLDLDITAEIGENDGWGSGLGAVAHGGVARGPGVKVGGPVDAGYGSKSIPREEL